MLEYICKDLFLCVRYLPYGLGAGIVCFLLLTLWNVVRGRRQKELIPTVPRTFFFTYLSVILMITFLSRESGSQRGLDLELFSTWGINKRNNAYVVENVLLFVPYGILSPLAFRERRSFWSCVLFGAATSLAVELLQLVTGRGYFQIDDILTNILGTLIGYVIFSLCRRS